VAPAEAFAAIGMVRGSVVLCTWESLSQYGDYVLGFDVLEECCRIRKYQKQND
jgi:hypothetical protein